MTSFLLKIIAGISMIIDHIGYFFFPAKIAFRYIGRLAFPIYAFQIAEGYSKTKNIKKYLLRLLIFALISQIIFILLKLEYLNIFFTLFLGALAIFLFDKIKNPYLGLISVGLIAFLNQFINADYGWFGILLIAFFHIFKEKKLLMTFATIITIIIKFAIPYINSSFHYVYLLMTLFTSLALIPILLYNGKLGSKKFNKLFYLLYPLHLLIIYLVLLIK